ncbi:transcriptional regulator [Streptosporangium nondiastaticum]|uniref:Transcriptional regulator n=1 Tax=Streptosporangium nondiastaticum TaxID=35764 RepID=A0A9X7PIX8_9ACTN|nr:helix-turn-helix domain-containing protein [Streptosporangium nondiastaticum]PSJ29546.1 transcriptional regulator [Streptosporangium nondiastaticum]
MIDTRSAVLLHPLAFVREQLGMGKMQFATAVRRHGERLGHHLGTTRSTIYKWERGDHAPDAVTQLVIADYLHSSGLRVSVEALGQKPWPLWLPAWEDQVIAAPWTQRSTLEALTALGSEPVDRRGFIGISGAALAGIGTQWATADPALAAATKGDQITSRTVDRMAVRIESIRAMEQDTGGVDFLDSARADLELLTRMISNSRYTDDIGKRLYTLAAEVCCLLGWMSYDAGLQAAAQKNYTTSLRAAKTANDDMLGAHTLCFMATQASNHQEQRAAVGLMESASSVSGRVPPAMQSSLAAHETTVLCKAGEHKRAAQALNRAFSALERASDDRPAYLRWFGESQLRSTEGRFLLATGQAGRATDALEKSVTHAAPRDQAVRCGTLALAYQRAGDLDGALDATERAIKALSTGIHTQRGVQRLQEVSKALAGHRSEPRVKEARAHIASLAAA